MTEEKESKQQIVKSSAVIGGASVINILVNLVKIKVLALLLGPAGVGLVAILSSVMGISSTLAGMGLQISGVRQLAQIQSDQKTLSRVRSALWIANLVLGLLGGLAVWFGRDPISLFIFGTSGHETDIGLLGFGVFLALIAASQTALLQGLRKISELAKVKIVSALVSALTGLASVWLWGEKGLVVFVIAVPAGAALASWYYCLKLPQITTHIFDFSALSREWRRLFALGFILMLTGLMTHATHLLVRYMINEQFDMVSVGYFQAAWTISMTYIGFILAAMATDYYPRLVSIIKDSHAVNDLMNHQLEMALTLAGPVLILMLALSPLVIYLLYTQEFSKSAEILRWQVFGDLFKIFSWPMGFILLALGKSWIFFFTELGWNALYCLFVYLGLEYIGIISTGYAFFLVYIVYALALYIVVNAVYPIKFSRMVVFQFFTLVMVSIILLILNTYSFHISAAVGMIMTLALSFYAYKKMEALGLNETIAIKIKEKLAGLSS